MMRSPRLRARLCEEFGVTVNAVHGFLGVPRKDREEWLIVQRKIDEAADALLDALGAPKEEAEIDVSDASFEAPRWIVYHGLTATTLDFVDQRGRPKPVTRAHIRSIMPKEMGQTIVPVLAKEIHIVDPHSASWTPMGNVDPRSAMLAWSEKASTGSAL